MQIRKTLLPFTISGVVLLCTATGFMCRTKNSAETFDKKGFAVVELFTSEGCSSCPSADAAAARLVAKNNDHVYVLAYHVDYWNKLGWKDSFSKAEYSQRQSGYAAQFKLNSIYTPQIVVNGSSEFVGSDERKLKSTVEKNIVEASPSDLSITTTKTSERVDVEYSITGNEEVILNLALVQPEATTVVKRGENDGKTLHHVNIVRFLKTITAKDKGKASLEIPKDLTYIPLQLLAFTQAQKDGQVLGADRKIL